jgi:hypothetical protein
MINAAEAAKQAAVNSPASGTGGYGSASDWASIISGAGQGASSAMQGAASYANSKKEAKEAKRRTLANLMSQAMKRNTGLFRAGQEHQDDLNDYQSQAIQQVARGFVDALQGSTG